MLREKCDWCVRGMSGSVSPLFPSVCVWVCCRSVGYGGPHDVHHSLPAHCQSGPRGLEASDMGLQLVIHVSSHTALCTHIHGGFMLPVMTQCLVTHLFNTWCIYLEQQPQSKSTQPCTVCLN